MITTSLVSLLLISAPGDSAKDVFLQTMANYGKLDSFSTDIEHDFSSGLFSGKYKQHLDFKKGKGFKLVVTSLKTAETKDKIAPDYFCDGADVTTVGRFDGTQPLNKDANLTPGYEVSGGLIMTWLLDSPTKDFFNKPPTGMKVDIDWGQRTTWHEEKVQEVVFKVSSGDRTVVASLFIDPEHKHFLGNEWTVDGKLGFMVYRHQKENPTVNTASFKPPVR